MSAVEEKPSANVSKINEESQPKSYGWDSEMLYFQRENSAKMVAQSLNMVANVYKKMNEVLDTPALSLREQIFNEQKIELLKEEMERALEHLKVSVDTKYTPPSRRF